jgi:DNA adenine methylase
MLPKLLKLIPDNKVYVEPYGGAASVLFTKAPSNLEVYNDMDWRLVNLMLVIKNKKHFEELWHRVYWTPYSFDEFKRSLDIIKNPKEHDVVTLAWAFFTAQNQSYGGIAKSAGNWGKAFTNDVGVAKKVRTYYLRVDRLPRHHQRLQDVSIESQDALQLVKKWDHPDTTFYLDPPYVPPTRVNEKVYKVDQEILHHEQLVKQLEGTQSAVVLSGYEHPVYEPLVDAGWERIDLKSYSSAAARNRNSKTRGEGSLLKHAARVEVIWRSPRASQLLPLTDDLKSRILKKQ